MTKAFQWEFLSGCWQPQGVGTLQMIRYLSYLVCNNFKQDTGCSLVYFHTSFALCTEVKCVSEEHQSINSTHNCVSWNKINAYNIILVYLDTILSWTTRDYGLTLQCYPNSWPCKKNHLHWHRQLKTLEVSIDLYNMLAGGLFKLSDTEVYLEPVLSVTIAMPMPITADKDFDYKHPTRELFASLFRV